MLLFAAASIVNADKIWSDCSKLIHIIIMDCKTSHTRITTSHFYAGTPEDKTRATIESITVNPDVPKKGEDLTIMATFTLSEHACISMDPK